jgi:hypothetical protein
MAVMDLSDISLEQAVLDTNIAAIRISQLSIQIDAAAQELRLLRENLLRRRQSSVVHALVASPSIELTWSLDEFCGYASPIAEPDRKFSISASESQKSVIRGWAIPTGLARPFEQIVTLIRGGDKTFHSSFSPSSREDVGAHFGNPLLVWSGFHFTIVPSDFLPGIYQLELTGRMDDGRETPPAIFEFEVV